MPKWKRMFPLFIVAAGILAYANSFSGSFVFDDHVVITGNHDLGNFFPVSFSARVVVDQTFKINFLTGGLKPADYHLTNLLIHILGGLMLYGIVRRTVMLPCFAGKYEEDSSLLACVVACLWIVHPLQTQSVTYICQRYEAMMGLFFLLSLYCFVRGYESEHKRFWYDLSIVACAIGMGTKEVMVAAPFVIFIYDYVFLASSVSVLVGSRGKVHAALFSCIGILACLLIGSLAKEMNVSTRFVDISPFLYLMNQCQVIAYYLRLAIVPYPLCLDYSWSATTAVLQLLPWVLFIAVLFTASTATCILKKPAGFLGLSFFAVLATTSSLIPVADLAFEHRMYLPLISVVVLSVFGSYSLAGCKGVSFKSGWLFLWCVILVLFIGLTFQRNYDYRSEESIWRDVVEKRPGNLRARNDLAVALSESGKINEALLEYDRVIERIPGDILAKLRTGAIVIEDVFITNSFEYQYFRANVNKATLMLSLDGGEKEAIKLYLNALRVAPFNGNVRERLKMLLRKNLVPEHMLDSQIQQLSGRHVK